MPTSGTIITMGKLMACFLNLKSREKEREKSAHRCLNSNAESYVLMEGIAAVEVLRTDMARRTKTQIIRKRNPKSFHVSRTLVSC
ncbi:hypothetical protein BDV06DRAFT_68227 [Aspergillus oleicola]